MTDSVLHSDSPFPSDPAPLSFNQNGALPPLGRVLSQEEPQFLMQIALWRSQPASQSSRQNYIEGFHSSLKNDFWRPSEKETIIGKSEDVGKI